jgi:periplasmic protein TonB
MSITKLTHILLLLLFSINATAAQSVSSPSNEITLKESITINDTIYDFVEQKAEFPNGLDSLHNYLIANLKYPAVAAKNGTQGRVILKFIVEIDGSLSNIQAIRQIGDGCAEEAIRVVSKMPKWQPGSTKGKKVRTTYTLPIHFNLNG